MSAPAFGPLVFTWTPDEARVAASRAALRAALSDGLLGRHLAPLAAFILALTFTAILALTNLVTRRHGEIALLLETGAFMLHRMATRRRFVTARRTSAATIEAMRAAGEVVLEVDERGVSLAGAAERRRWNFADGLEVEDAGGMIYLWPRAGAPAFLPTRVFLGDAAARDFVAFARARSRQLSDTRRRLNPPPPSRPTP
jgi:hypothetical protein